MMRKHLPMYLVCIAFWAMFLWVPQQACGADVEWQIDWQEDGSLSEQLSLPDQYPLQLSTGWKVEKQGNNYVYFRHFEKWEDYLVQTERMPLIIDQRNYILATTSTFFVDEQSAGTLFKQLNELEGFTFKLRVAGIIKDTTGQVDENTVVFRYNKSKDFLSEDTLAKITTVDGFLVGICILVLGLVGIFIFFVGRLKKVDRMISEIYSLENIDLSLLDEEERG
ncbi:MAG: hypothetical protein U9N81_08160 [Bacillota bacterium]|nr:hypothetical protein [Bacillota bacterium]